MRSKSALAAECLTSAMESGLGGMKAGKPRSLGFVYNLGGHFANGDMGVIMIPEGLHGEVLLEAFASRPLRFRARSSTIPSFVYLTDLGLL